jgi:hypothetical protein
LNEGNNMIELQKESTIVCTPKRIHSPVQFSGSDEH